MLKLRMCSPESLVEPSENGSKLEYKDYTTMHDILDSLELAGRNPSLYGSLIVLGDDAGCVVEVWATMVHNPGTCYMIYPESKAYEVVE